MSSMSKLIAIFIFAASVSLSGCATHQAGQQADVAQANEGDPRDPLEPLNRVMWDLNWEVVDAYLLRPVTVAYVTVMPGFARTGLLNAAQNLAEPANMLNNFFQGKTDAGMDSLARFALNSTVGLLGTIDVAKKIGIARQEEEFGQTMGTWGVGTGPFLMLPLLGPNDPRSFSGEFVDGTVWPMAVVNSNFAIARYLVSVLETRATLLDQEQQIEQSIDDYAFVKNAYFENLAFQVTDGKSGDKELEEEQLDDFAEFESMLNDMESDDDDDEPEEENNRQ